MCKACSCDMVALSLACCELQIILLQFFLLNLLFHLLEILDINLYGLLYDEENKMKIKSPCSRSLLKINGSAGLSCDDSRFVLLLLKLVIGCAVRADLYHYKWWFVSDYWSFQDTTLRSSREGDLPLPEDVSNFDVFILYLKSIIFWTWFDNSIFVGLVSMLILC